MGPLSFQDDLIHSSDRIREARIACAKIDKVVKQLNLRLHEDKSCCILIGSQKQRQDMRRELELEPLSSGNIVIHPKENVKWLGQILSSDGLAASVADTVKDQEGKIRGANLEIIQIVTDWRSQVVGGMETALVLWESCCVSSLLHAWSWDMDRHICHNNTEIKPNSEFFFKNGLTAWTGGTTSFTIMGHSYFRYVS